MKHYVNNSGYSLIIVGVSTLNGNPADIEPGDTFVADDDVVIGYPGVTEIDAPSSTKEDPEGDAVEEKKTPAKRQPSKTTDDSAAEGTGTAGTK